LEQEQRQQQAVEAREEPSEQDLAGINELLACLFGFNIDAGEEAELDAKCKCPPESHLDPAAKPFVPKTVEAPDAASAPVAAPAVAEEPALPADLNALLNTFLGLQVDPATADDKPAGGQQLVGSAVDNLNDILSRWGLEFVPDDDLSAAEDLASAEKTAEAIGAEDRQYTDTKNSDLRAVENLAKLVGVGERVTEKNHAAAAARDPALGEAEKLVTAANTARDIERQENTYHHDKSNREAEAEVERLAKAEGIAQRLDKEEQQSATARSPALGAAERLVTAFEATNDIAHGDNISIRTHNNAVAEAHAHRSIRTDFQTVHEPKSEADIYIPADGPEVEPAPDRPITFITVEPARPKAAKDASAPPKSQRPVVRGDYDRVHEPEHQQDISIDGPGIEPARAHAPEFVSAAPFTSTLDSYAQVPGPLRDILAAVEGSLRDQKPPRPRKQRKAAPVAPEDIRARDEANAQLDNIDAQFDALTHAFTFPRKLAFGPSTLDRTQPPLLFNRNNTPYHAQAHALLQLILKADGVQANNNRDIRRRRKAIVAKIEKELQSLEARRDGLWTEVSDRRDRGETDDEVYSTPTDSDHSDTDGFEVL
jgi:hypothetical protein